MRLTLIMVMRRKAKNESMEKVKMKTKQAVLTVSKAS